MHCYWAEGFIYLGSAPKVSSTSAQALLPWTLSCFSLGGTPTFPTSSTQAPRKSSSKAKNCAKRRSFFAFYVLICTNDMQHNVLVNILLIPASHVYILLSHEDSVYGNGSHLADSADLEYLPEEEYVFLLLFYSDQPMAQQKATSAHMGEPDVHKAHSCLQALQGNQDT